MCVSKTCTENSVFIYKQLNNQTELNVNDFLGNLG